jgi:hypothetical protein
MFYKLDESYVVQYHQKHVEFHYSQLKQSLLEPIQKLGKLESYRNLFVGRGEAQETAANPSGKISFSIKKHHN